MVFREGVETVLILGAVSLNSTELLSFLGTLAGVIVAIVFGVMFVKGSVRINLQKFFRVTTVILFFVAAQLIISGLHELSENGVLPSSQPRDGTHWPHRAQRSVFLHHHRGIGRPDGSVRGEAPTTRCPSRVSGRTAQGAVERAPRTAVDGFGLRQFVRVHPDGHGGIYLCQERERTLARDSR